MSISIPTNPADANSIVNRITMAEVQIAVDGGAVVLLSDLQAQYNCLIFTGTLAQDVAVEVPAEAKGWDVQNATTGAFSVTVKASGTVGVVVAQAARTRLRYSPFASDVVAWA